MTPLKCLVVLACLLAWLPSRALALTRAYVSMGGDKRITWYDLNEADGTLAEAGSVELPGAPGAHVWTRDHKRLYVAVRSKGLVTVLQKNDKGELAVLDSASIGGNAAYLSLTPDASRLLAAYYGDHRVAIFGINREGLVMPAPLAEEETRKNPHSIQTSPDGHWVLVPNTGADVVLQWPWDVRRRTMAPGVRPIVTEFESGDGPRHFAFHPRLDLVYFVNEKSSTVTAARWDAGSGNLEPFQNISTLGGATNRNTCADIHVTPDGRHVFASNRGHDSLAMFTVRPETGALDFVACVATEATPREFAIDPSGRWLVAAGQKSGQLAVYALQASGAPPERVSVHEAGKGPSWVTLLDH